MTRNGKVIHISDELHRRIGRFCKKENVSQTAWVDDVLKVGLSACGEKRPGRKPKAAVESQTELKADCPETQV